jgi:GntR family transcriptional regulator/MocR family aminotransferase
MRIPLDRHAAAPLYRQIEDYVRQGILMGSLAPEMRLPASRQLAEQLGVNRLTVETAYANLEADGLVLSRVGSGTYVLAPSPLPPLPRVAAGGPWPLWQQSLRRDVASGPSPAEMLAAARHPHPIDLASGISDSQLFPADEFRKVLQIVMRRDGVSAVAYEDRRGYGPLRETIARTRATQGVQTRPENVLITAGSQQALALVAQLLLDPGDVILVESPTYALALDLFRAHGFEVVGIPVDEQGMRVELLEGLLQRHHPRLIYTIPTFHNPTGTCLSGPRRHELVVLADRYNVPILEDDFVGDLRYDGRALPAL